ncbi:MAG: hypothetical protein LBE79_11815 [Tannerella sp.]|jgi:hypothetical protein|nr:hypothetical protein [Tannerella sp.]
MKVYLDNCSYNRPFDNQNQMRIYLETQPIREPFDYTKWQREHYADMSVSELNRKAVEYAKNNPIVKNIKHTP